MSGANVLKGTNFVPGTKFVPELTEARAGAMIAMKVDGWSEGQLATISGKTKEAAKAWKQGKRCPHLASALKLARQISGLQEWLMEEAGCGGRDAEPGSFDAAMRMLHVAAAGTGANALKAQQMLAIFYQARRSPPEQTERDTNTIDFLEEFDRRRG